MKYEIVSKFHPSETYYEISDYLHINFKAEIRMMGTWVTIYEINCTEEEATFLKLKFPNINIVEI